MERTVRSIKTVEEFKIFADPFRMKIIDIYNEHNKPMTVKMVADILGEVPAKVHYHVKKLLSINILIFDHIEIINGINAKYYILKDQAFRLDVENNSSPEMKSFTIDTAVSVLFKRMDAFKQDILARAENAKQSPIQNIDDGFISYRKVHLTEDDAKTLRKMIVDYLNEHDQEGENTQKYSFLGAFMRLTDKQQ